MSPRNYPDKDLTRLDNLSYADSHDSTSATYSVNIVTFKPNSSIRKHETKKEKTKRIAKEKMFASWKTYNQKTEKILDIKQICKPRHNKINNGISAHRR